MSFVEMDQEDKEFWLMVSIVVGVSLVFAILVAWVCMLAQPSMLGGLWS